MLDFPASPTLNQTFTGPNSVVWAWDGIKWVNGTQVATGYAPIQSPALTGNPTSVTPASGDADTSIATTAFVAPAFANVGRNLLHNSMFNIQQRGTGAWTTSSVYTADRWQTVMVNGTLSVTIKPHDDTSRAQIGDETAAYYLAGLVAGGSGVNDEIDYEQKIENVRRTAGKILTLSFWAATAAGTLKLGAMMYQVFGTGGSPSPLVVVPGQSVTLSPTWARYALTFVIPSIAGKTLGTAAASDYLAFRFCLSAGSSAGASYGNPGVQSGTIAIWGVQLEVGSVATPLEKPDPELQLRQCMRFYQTGIVQRAMVSSGITTDTIILPFPVTMRALPVMTVAFSTQTNTVGSVNPQSGYGYQLNSAISIGAGNGTNLFGTFTASADL